jgi:hypothetical protein
MRHAGATHNGELQSLGLLSAVESSLLIMAAGPQPIRAPKPGRRDAAKISDLDKAMSTLGPNLLERFESDRGYRNFPETLDCRTSLPNLQPMRLLVPVSSGLYPTSSGPRGD